MNFNYSKLQEIILEKCGSQEKFVRAWDNWDGYFCRVSMKKYHGTEGYLSCGQFLGLFFVSKVQKI